MVEHRHGEAHLHYTGPETDAAGCFRRQAWVLATIARAGGRRATLHEEACLARGATACDYHVVWSDGSRVLPATIAVLSCAVALVAAWRAIGWLFVAGAVASVYALGEWHARQARRRAQAASASASRWLLARALEEPPCAPDAGAASPPSAAVPVLEQVGEFWRIGYGDTTVMLRHSRGLALLAHLVRSPGVEVHVRDLDAMTPSGGSAVAREAPAPEADGAPSPGDAGEILDQRARAEYRTRIKELQVDLADVERCHDLGRTAAIRREIDQLGEQLRAGTAAGGRARRASADVERLRIAITRRIRAAIAQIARHHPALGTHLDATVTTGYSCAYYAARDGR